MKGGPGYRVAEKRCDECLFSKSAIVDDARRRAVLRNCERNDAHFICHKFTVAGEEAQCRGDYDRDPMRTNLSRIAHRLGAVEFVPIPGDDDERCTES